MIDFAFWMVFKRSMKTKEILLTKRNGEVVSEKYAYARYRAQCSKWGTSANSIDWFSNEASHYFGCLVAYASDDLAMKTRIENGAK